MAANLENTIGRLKRSGSKYRQLFENSQDCGYKVMGNLFGPQQSLLLALELHYVHALLHLVLEFAYLHFPALRESRIH